jgi:molybdate transport system substrate-binding protein
MTSRGLLLVAHLAVAASCAPRAESSPAGDRRVMVLAAASLTEVLQSIAEAWTAQGHPQVVLSFDATSRLAKQITAGVGADLFFSADRDWMDFLSLQSLLAAETRVELAGNSLVAIIPAESTAPLFVPRDLVRAEVTRLALAGESVPAGKYARAALMSLGIWKSLESRVMSGDNARTVLAWVAHGEVDAGVVYVTDAKSEPRVRVAFVFSPDTHPPIRYLAAVLRDAPHPQDAGEFLAFCRGPEGQALFRHAGFTQVPTP